MQQAACGASADATEEPPTPRNVLLARCGVALGLAALALLVILAAYAWGSAWSRHEELLVWVWARQALSLIVMSGLGVALYGYGLARTEKNAAEQQRQDAHRFEALRKTDVMLTDALRHVCDELTELRALVAEHDLREEWTEERGALDQASEASMRESLLAALREELAKTVKDVWSAGYVAGVRARPGLANGSGELHLVRGQGDE